MVDKLSTQERGETGTIKLVFSIGAKLAKGYPEIASDYSDGLTHNQIAEKYEIAAMYNLTAAIAKNAVGHALSILLDPSERKRISNTFLHAKKTRGGKMTHEKGVGLFAIPEKARKITLNRARYMSILANGRVPWNSKVIDIETHKNEHDYCIHLSQQPEFIHQSGSHKGRPNAVKIASKLNEVFHAGQTIRTPRAIITRLYKNKKLHNAK